MGHQVLAQGIPAARNAFQGFGSSKLNHTAGFINQGPAKETPADAFLSKCYSPTRACCSYQCSNHAFAAYCYSVSSPCIVDQKSPEGAAEPLMRRTS